MIALSDTLELSPRRPEWGLHRQPGPKFGSLAGMTKLGPGLRRGDSSKVVPWRQMSWRLRRMYFSGARICENRPHPHLLPALGEEASLVTTVGKRYCEITALVVR